MTAQLAAAPAVETATFSIEPYRAGEGFSVLNPQGYRVGLISYEARQESKLSDRDICGVFELCSAKTGCQTPLERSALCTAAAEELNIPVEGGRYKAKASPENEKDQTSGIYAVTAPRARGAIGA